MNTQGACPAPAKEPAVRIFTQPQAGPVNIGDTERLISVFGGAALTAFGLSRRSLGGLVLAALGGGLVYRGATGHCMTYQALGVSTVEHRRPLTGVPAQEGLKVVTSITVQRPADELYAFWRKFENLPKIMDHLETVEELDAVRSRWVARGPLGIRLEWTAEIHNEQPGQMIAWRSLPGAEVDTAGSVHFREQQYGRGTRVDISMKYSPPGGSLTAKAAEFLGMGLEERVKNDLRKFKSLMEAGELPTADGQPVGERSWTGGGKTLTNLLK